jgi:serine/threonine protein kinase
MDKRERIQMDHILNHLHISPLKSSPKITCEIDYTNGSSMDSIDISDTDSNKCPTKLSKVKTASNVCNVFLTDLESMKVILKIPKEKKSKPCFEKYSRKDTNLIREGYIGVNVLNNLRYIVPNFMYTFGVFTNDKNELCLACEYIEGITLQEAIKTNVITTDIFMNIFIQVLLCLEVAQREYRFCHYDLHSNNIILRKLKNPYKYTVVLDNKQYDIVAKDYIATLIDFGLSSVTINNLTIGEYNYTDHGIFNYCLQGVDMYKFLFYSYIYAKEPLRKYIGSLFLFYESYDPYRIINANNQNIETYAKEYIRQISFTRISSYIPLEFIEWLGSKGNIIGQTRTLYKPIQCRNIEIEKLPVIPNESYIMICYIDYILKKCGKNSNTYTNCIKNSLISNDKRMLNKYRDINCPNEFKLRDTANTILSSNSINVKLYKRFLRQAEFFNEILPFLQYFYTIKEVNLVPVYKDFMKSFETSCQYKCYCKLSMIVEKTKRWCIRLIIDCSV